MSNQTKPNQEAEPLLRVLGPLKMTALSAIAGALPPGTYFRQTGTVEHQGQTCAVFEFIESAVAGEPTAATKAYVDAISARAEAPNKEVAQ